VPPAALTVWLYVVPTVPAGSVGGFTVTAAFTVNVNARDPVAPLPSVAVIVKLPVAAVVGVPVIAPVDALSVSPAGSVPALMLNA